MDDTVARQAREGIHQDGVLPTFSSAGDLVERQGSVACVPITLVLRAAAGL